MPANKRLSWLQIAGLGIGLVVAGQFGGWNYGLAAGGFANMCVAAVLMGGMCFGLSMCVAELAAAIPNAGGIYIYCEAALGRLAGFLVGIFVFAALTISTGAAAEFLSAYCLSTFGFGGVMLKAALFIALTALHIRSVGEGVRMALVAGFIAVISLFAFGLTMLPHVEFANFGLHGDHPVSFSGIFACMPFAIMLFISIEQCATAAEEARDARTDIPRGMFAAILILGMTAFCVLVLGTGANGVARLATASDPLAVGVSGEAGWLRTLIGAGAVFGLIATIFSLQFGASRQLFALAREHYVPACFARVNRFGAPHIALSLIGAVGFGMSFVPPDRVLVAFIMVLSGSYIVLQASFIRLSLTRPDLPRPFRAPGGIVTGLVSLLLAAIVFVSSLSGDRILMSVIAAFIVLSLIFYAWTSHNRPSSLPGPIKEETP